jgi:16S rRNA G966 N2-methylase RsmD
MANHSHHRHGHSHGREQSGKNLRIAFFLNLGFSVLEFFGGILVNSIAIVSDAIHDLGDSISLGTAWYLDKKSRQDPDKKYSFGYRRFSLLGALINSVVLIAGSVYVIYEAVGRLIHPQHSDAGGMLVFAIIGILVNGYAAWKMSSGKTLNEKVVSWHLLEDLLGWVAVMIVAIVLHFKDMNYPFAIRQISGYQHIVNKIPDWYACPDILFPPTLSLEQCSSQQTACYKRDLMKTIIRKQKQEQTISGADLTGGFGVDAYYLSEVFDRFFYVEKQPELCRIASHNFKALNRPGIQVFENESEEFLQQSGKLDFVYLDPSRRNRDGNKVTALRDCSPDPATLYEDLIKKAGLVLIKLSPMIDLSLALKALPHTRQIHVVALDNDCKEVLFLLDAKYQTAEPEITAVNLKNNAADQVLKFRRSDEANASCVYTAQVGDYLYEPNVSLLKAGAFIMPAQAYGLEKLHKNTHLYTSNKFKSD